MWAKSGFLGVIFIAVLAGGPEDGNCFDAD